MVVSWRWDNEDAAPADREMLMKVRYDDGDAEELTESEIQPLFVTTEQLSAFTRRTQAQYVHGFERAGYVPLTQSPPETPSPTPIADLSADQLRARAAALDGQLEKQREATSQLLDYCDSFQFVLDARERQLGGQRRALSRLHSSGDAELAAAERRADEAEVAATFLQQQVDDLSGKLADSEAAATARVADLANELKQARELKAASERLGSS
eukprot:jgi/Tetstr1/439620/TSEL_028042.t1